MLMGPWNWYQTQMAINPVPTQVISSGILWAAGHIGAQYVSFSIQKQRHQYSHDKEGKGFRIDWKKVATTSLFGFGFVGPVGHFWYEGLEHVTRNYFQLMPSTWQFVAVKLVADSLLLGPVHLLAYFTYMGLASGKTFDEVKGDIKRDFLPAFMTEGFAWPAVQAVNFRFVPVPYQLLYVNFFCLLDSAFLSWFVRQENAPWKRRLTSLLSAKGQKEHTHQY